SRGAAELNAALKQAVELADYGLEVKPAGKSGEAMLTSRGTYLSPRAVEAAQRAAKSMGVTPRLVTINLVNAIVKLSEAASLAPVLRGVGGGEGRPASLPSAVPTT